MNKFINHTAILFQIFTIPIIPATTKAYIAPLEPIEAGITMPTFQKFGTLPVSHFEAYPSLDTIPVAQVTTPAPNAQSSTANLGGAVANCGDSYYAHLVYQAESGCRLVNPNGSGCDGIGQACPASKIYNACPNMDYACQNAWYTDYMQRTYGSWQNAWYVRESRCGSPQGCWW